jgi:NhaA family Na+:H+ antiporter
MLNRSGVYRVTPYVITGVLLWVFVHAGGLHATLAGVLLAAFIPTRKPPDYQALALQAEAILEAEASHGGEQFRSGPSEPALRELDEIHDRLESPRTVCCATSRRDRVIWCCRSSRWRTAAW